MSDKGGLIVPGKVQLTKPRQKWVCTWQDGEGRSIVDDMGRYLCAESWNKGDPRIEAKMKDAAIAFGVGDGQPVWFRGEKISQMEWEDQMERYLEGKIPDPVEEYRLAVEKAEDELNGGFGEGITR